MFVACGSCLLRRKANARNVSYTPNPAGEKHTIATFGDQTRIIVNNSFV